MSNDGDEVGNSENRDIPTVLLEEMSLVVEPLTNAVTSAADGDPSELRALLSEMGLGESELGQSYDRVESELRKVLDAWESVEAGVFERESVPTPAEIEQMKDAFGTLFDTIKGLNEFEVPDIDTTAVGDQVIDYLLVRYLRMHHGTVFSLLALSGIVTEGSGGEPSEVEFSKLPLLLNDPMTLSSEAFGWGTEEFEGMLVLYYVHELLWERGLAPIFLESDESLVPAFQGESAHDEDESELELYIPVLEIEGSFTTGVKIIPLPPQNDALPGLAVVPFGALGGRETFDVGGGWTFNVAASAELDDWGMSVRPGQEPELSMLDGSSSPVRLGAEGELEYSAASERGEKTLLGSPDGSRISVRTIGVKATVEYSNEEVLFGVSLPTTGCISFHPSDFDGFLRSVFPPDDFTHDFDVTAGWSSDAGLYFERGSSLEASLPQHARFGPVELNEIYLAARPPGEGETGPIRLDASASATVSIGPVTANVGRMGLSADVDFPEDASGNFGPLDFEFGFQPPRRIGLDVDAEAVTGGGFLEFDPENERYAGVVDLQIGSLSLKAIGLLTTRLPRGESGFSLLILVTAEGFTPVSLGLGFTLNAVGGLLGVNRRLDSPSLLEAVRSGSMDSVLFPRNPVKNATKVVNDLRRIFPPTKGTHVVGPMVRLGWGTPSILTADLGVVLELPSGRLALLGRLQTVLPHEEAPVIDLCMDGAGVLEPPEQRVAFDATLVESRVAMWAVRGDMAMRTRWGDDPHFVVSVGGFNPRYRPPVNFPNQERVRLSLGAPGGNPSVEFGGYFALTSNTAQTGAAINLHAEAGPVAVDGHLQFDALFQFDPFKFVTDLSATLKAVAFGETLDVRVEGTFSGPTPWRLTGSAYIDVLGFVDEHRIDETFGESVPHEPLPRARILPKLASAFENTANWTAQLPEGGDALVTVRSNTKRETDTILAHPLGSLRVRQSVVPLDFDIDIFGGTTPAKHTRFTIDEISIPGSTALDLGTTTTERFARAQYERLSDAERLNAPGFERLAAGRAATNDHVYLGYDEDEDRDTNTRKVPLTFETRVVDKGQDNWSTPLEELGRFNDPVNRSRVSIPAKATRVLSTRSAAARAKTRTTGLDRFTLSEAERSRFADRDSGIDLTTGGVATKLSVDEATYVIVRKTDLVQTSVGTDESDDSPMTRAEAERALERYNDADTDRRSQFRVVEASRARKATADGGRPVASTEQTAGREQGERGGSDDRPAENEQCGDRSTDRRPGTDYVAGRRLQ